MEALQMSVAIVLANKDPEGLGRLQIRYPSYDSAHASKPSQWARVCSPYASNAHGAWFLPDIGDEVLVLFERGNLEEPIIIGSLYSQKNMPPQGGFASDKNHDGQNSLKLIQTKSGSQIFIEDKGGECRVGMKTKEGQEIEINSKEKKITLKQNGKAKISLEESKTVIHHAQKIELGEGAAEALVKGKMFMQFFNAHTHPIPTGLSGAPTAPMNPSLLSEKVMTG